MAPRRARAAFAQRGVRGEIVVEQRSPWDQSRLLVNLTGLNGLAGGFHVHEYPVPIPKHAGNLFKETRLVFSRFYGPSRGFA